MNLKANLYFNELSEISFDYPEKIGYEDETSNLFNEIKENRLIYSDGIGRYVITGITKNNDGIKNILTVKATSLEYELTYRKLTLFNGTYKFYDPLKPSDSLLGKIVEAVGNWKIDYVSSELCTKYRTFEISDDTVYAFLSNTVSKSYDCIFQFDTYNQTISAYSVHDIIKPTDVFVSYTNLIKNECLETAIEGIYTAVSCYGGNDLSIAQVNPMGGNTIYKFEHCYSDMSDDLVKVLKQWRLLFEAKKVEYQNKLLSIKNENVALIKLNSELVELNSDYKAKKEVQSAMIQGSQTNTTEYKIVVADMTTIDGRIKTKEKEIADKQVIVDNLRALLTAINNQLSFNNRDIFTDKLYNELQYFIRETTYQDDTFTQTSAMSLVEIQDMAQDLYDHCADMLDKISQPRYDITVDSINFLFLPEFAPIVNRLDHGSDEKVKQLLGCSFNLEINEDEYIQPTLLSLSLNYDKPTEFSMTFANRYKMSGGMWTLSDLISQAGRSAKSTSFTYSSVKDFNSYKGDLVNFMNSSLDVTKNELVNNSKNIEMQLDATGLIGKKINPLTGDYSGEQMWLTNNVLAFTRDKFATVETALGKILLPNGTYDYGLNAGVLMGKQIFGASQTISNESNTILMDQQGFQMTTNNNAGRITLFPADGIKIQTNNGSGWKDKFYVDAGGNALFEGKLKAYEGTIGGFNIGQNSISSNNGIIDIKSDGTGKMGLMSWNQNSATFIGKIFADNLDDYGITAKKIEDETITPQKLDRIYATEGQFDRLSATVADINEAYVDKATVNTLIADKANISDLNATTASVNSLWAQVGKFDEVITFKGNAAYLNATNVNSVIVNASEGFSGRFGKFDDYIAVWGNRFMPIDITIDGQDYTVLGR